MARHIKTQLKVSSTAVNTRNLHPPKTRADNKYKTNTDSCCLGKKILILNYTKSVADVHTYNKSYNTLEGILTINGSTFYDNEVMGNTYIFMFHEAMNYRFKLYYSLINPNQCRYYGIDFCDNPYDHIRGTGIDANDELHLQMATKGKYLLFSTRDPNKQ